MVRHASDWLPAVRSGVNSTCMQGSVVDLLLFNLYIPMLYHSVTNSTLKAFADDMTTDIHARYSCKYDWTVAWQARP